MSESPSGTDTLLDRDLAPADPGDHDRFSHYVKKDDVMPSAINGTPVRALCGKIWVPNRDPEKFPMCPECKEIYDTLMA